MFIKLENIKEIQIDHTTRCNLGCPQCARTQYDWWKQDEHKNVDLSLDDYKILLEPVVEDKTTIFHCGNFGDVIASPTFEETFLYSLSKNPGRINIATNGALRTPSWWENLAKMGGKRLQVTFAIDGLQDTNHIYRIGAQWDKLIKNVQAFIDAGGKARWDFIEFEHNYHQVEEAEELARQMGFEKFNVKYTARFASRQLTKEKTSNNNELVDRKNNVNQESLKEIKKEYSSFEDYIQKTNISCKYQKDQKVFVDMHMRLWPCCWFGAPLYFNSKSPQYPDFQHLVKIYGKDFNNLRKHGWEVLNHDFYQNYLEQSWQKPDDKYKRIYTCGRTCGEKFEFSSGYGVNSNIKVIQKEREVSGQ